MTSQVLRSLAGLGLLALGSSCASSDSGAAAAACEPVTFSMLNVANSEAKVCAAATRCMAEECATTVNECAGPDFMNGVYSGTCATYFDCVKGCKCEKACADRCDPGSLDCASCLSSSLAMGCTLKCPTEIASCGKR